MRTSFFDLGGHSVLAVRMMAHIKKAFGRTLPLSALLGGGTIEAIADLLRGEGDIAWDSLVPIQTSGSRRPSFWVHAAGGNVLSYLPIAAHLGADFPMYGLQARGLEPGQEPGRDLVRMAAEYVAAVLRQQPHGPYIIAGWSFGGMVALEMCRQLIAAGERVAELIMVDTGTNDASPRGMDPQDPVFLAGMATFLSNGTLAGLRPDLIAELPPTDRAGHVVEVMRQAGILPTGFEVADLHRTLAVYSACNDAYRGYSPAGLPVKTTLIRAAENPDPDPSLAWRASPEAPLRVIGAPGNHVSVMTPVHIAAFADALGRVLTEASA